MSDLADRTDDVPDLAAEYALGVLDGADRRAAERRMREDSAFAGEVEWWQGRFAPLLSSIPESPAPSALWDRVSEDIDRVRKVQGDARPASRRESRRKAIGNVSPIWRTLAGASSLLAVASLGALAVILPDPPAGGVFEPTLAASLASDTGEPLFTIVIDPASRMATLVPVRAMTDRTRVPELWLIRDPSSAPLSLGVVDLDHPLRVRLESLDMEAPGAALAVSMEPQGGSPSGSPTGPVVASGALDRI